MTGLNPYGSYTLKQYGKLRGFYLALVATDVIDKVLEPYEKRMLHECYSFWDKLQNTT